MTYNDLAEGLPNLDNCDDLDLAGWELFFRDALVGPTAEALGVDRATAAEVLARCSYYARCAREARAERLAGRIDLATFSERAMESAYRLLPEDLRW